MNIGEKIKICRQSKKMSREDLANNLVLSKYAIAKYEQGQRMPSAKLISRIASVLDVSSEYLVDENIVDKNRLKEMLVKKNTTLYELKSKLKLEESFIKIIEEEKDIIKVQDINSLYELCDYLEINSDYLLNKTDFKFYEEFTLSDIEILIDEVKNSKNDESKVIFRDMFEIIFLTLHRAFSSNKTKELNLIFNLYKSIYKFQNLFTNYNYHHDEPSYNERDSDLKKEDIPNLINNTKVNLCENIDDLAKHYQNLNEWLADHSFDEE